MIALFFTVDDDGDDPDDDDQDPDDDDHDTDDDDHDLDDDAVVTQSWGEGRTIQPASAQWSHRQFTAAAIFTTGSLGSLKKEYLQGEFPPKNIC